MFKLKALFLSCCTAQSNQNDDSNLAQRVSARRSESTINSPNPADSANQAKNKKITEADVLKGPKLKMIAIEGTLLPLETEFVINAKGLAGVKKSRGDGETYIGFLKDQLGSRGVANDIVLEDSSVGNQHCLIRYHPERKKYYLQDLGEGSGTFIKIEKELELKSGYIISFSDSHMLIHTRDMDINSGLDDEAKSPQEDKKGNITIKFLDGPKVDQVFRFKAEDKMIKIGRMNDCQIKFDDNNLSRYQCTFKFLNGAWHIIDGYIIDGLRTKSSTNGTWLLVDNTIELFNEMVLKVGQTLFKLEIDSGSQ